MSVLRSLVVTIALTLCVAPNASLLIGQEPNPSDWPLSTRESLQGLSGVQVQAVFTVDRQAAKASPNREAVRTFIESLLGDANVRSLGPTDASPRPAYLKLDVGISTLIVGGEPFGWAYVLRLQVLQEVCVEGVPRSSGWYLPAHDRSYGPHDDALCSGRGRGGPIPSRLRGSQPHLREPVGAAPRHIWPLHAPDLVLVEPVFA
jgi:hypothetical protein